MKTISYAITVCNEIVEIINIFNYLKDKIRKEDEIVIQYDVINISKKVLKYLNFIEKTYNVKVFGFPLNMDFSTFKNNIKNYCNKDYIFQIDADEIPHENLLNSLPQILENNPVDLFYVPRVNIIKGIDLDILSKNVDLNINDKGWINYPDYQSRIYKINSKVTWTNKLHETLINHKDFIKIECQEKFSLYHVKSLEKALKQHYFYETF